MTTRTLDNCKLVQEYGRPNQYDGMCEGFGTSETNDEPCRICQECKLNYLYNDDIALKQEVEGEE